MRLGESATLTVELTGPAPRDGMVIALRSSKSYVMVPRTATVDAGRKLVVVTVTTGSGLPLTSTGGGEVSATLNLDRRSAFLTVRP